MVGNAGLGGAWGIIVLSFCIAGATGFSMSSFVTNIRVGPGGAFSMISQSLGLEVGGAIGLPLYLSQALAVVMYIFGFRAGWQWPAGLWDFRHSGNCHRPFGVFPDFWYHDHQHPVGFSGSIPYSGAYHTFCALCWCCRPSGIHGPAHRLVGQLSRFTGKWFFRYSFLGCFCCVFPASTVSWLALTCPEN